MEQSKSDALKPVNNAYVIVHPGSREFHRPNLDQQAYVPYGDIPKRMGEGDVVIVLTMSELKEGVRTLLMTGECRHTIDGMLAANQGRVFEVFGDERELSGKTSAPEDLYNEINLRLAEQGYRLMPRTRIRVCGESAETCCTAVAALLAKQAGSDTPPTISLQHTNVGLKDRVTKFLLWTGILSDKVTYQPDWDKAPPAWMQWWMKFRKTLSF